MACNQIEFDWTAVTEQFETSFKIAFSTDKKAHFDNLPDELKIIDGAKGFWSQLLLFDGIIYILVNDSFNSSSRRAFNQYKVICDCIIQQLERINPEIHSEILQVKRTVALTNGHYLAVPIEMSKFLADKFSHLIAVDQLDFPWSSIANLRSNLLGFEGPPSKAKAKFAQITDLLLSNEHFAHYKNDIDSLIRTVIYRVLFVWQTPLGAMDKTTRVRNREVKDKSNKKQRDEQASDKHSVQTDTVFSLFHPDIIAACAPQKMVAPSVRGDDLLVTSWSDDQFDSFFDDCHTDYSSTFSVDKQSEKVSNRKCKRKPRQSAMSSRGPQCAAVPVVSLKQEVESAGEDEMLVPFTSQMIHTSQSETEVSPTFPTSNESDGTSVGSSGNSTDADTSSGSGNTSSSSSGSQDHSGTTSVSRGDSNDDSVMDEDTQSLLLGETPRPRPSIDRGEHSPAQSTTSATTNSQPALILHVEPHATEYVMYGDVLCAVVPVSDPGLIAQARAMFRGGGGGGGGQQQQQQTCHSTTSCQEEYVSWSGGGGESACKSERALPLFDFPLSFIKQQPKKS